MLGVAGPKVRARRPIAPCWMLKFGPIIARHLREFRPKAYTRWHLDEMVVSIVLASRDCMSKECAPTIGPRIRISRFDDANKRCKVSNQPIRLSAWFLSTQRFTTRSTHPSTRNASSDARHKAGHDDENYEQCEAAVQPCGKRRRPGTADFVRPRTYCVSRSTCASGRDQILFFAAKNSKA
jgi:hypothetical protein